MRTIRYIVSLAFLIVFSSACNNEPLPTQYRIAGSYAVVDEFGFSNELLSIEYGMLSVSRNYQDHYAVYLGNEKALYGWDGGLYDKSYPYSIDVQTGQFSSDYISGQISLQGDGSLIIGKKKLMPLYDMGEGAVKNAFPNQNNMPHVWYVITSPDWNLQAGIPMRFDGRSGWWIAENVYIRDNDVAFAFGLDKSWDINRGPDPSITQFNDGEWIPMVQDGNDTLPGSGYIDLYLSVLGDYMVVVNHGVSVEDYYSKTRSSSCSQCTDHKRAIYTERNTRK